MSTVRDDDTLDVLLLQASEEAKAEESRVHQADRSAAGIITLGVVTAGFVTAMVSNAKLDTWNTRWLIAGIVAIAVAIVLAFFCLLGPARFFGFGRRRRGALKSSFDEARKAIDEERQAVQAGGSTSAEASATEVRRHVLRFWGAWGEWARFEADKKEPVINLALVSLAATVVPLVALAWRLARTL